MRWLMHAWFAGLTKLSLFIILQQSGRLAALGNDVPDKKSLSWEAWIMGCLILHRHLFLYARERQQMHLDHGITGPDPGQSDCAVASSSTMALQGVPRRPLHRLKRLYCRHPPEGPNESSFDLGPLESDAFTIALRNISLAVSKKPSY